MEVPGEEAVAAGTHCGSAQKCRKPRVLFGGPSLAYRSHLNGVIVGVERFGRAGVGRGRRGTVT